MPALTVHRLAPAAALAAILSSAASAATGTGIDEEARLPYWEIVGPAVSIRLVQRLPDQTRGFFQARGFSVPDADLIARSCVFQTVFKHLAPPSSGPRAIEYDLRDWVVHAAGSTGALITREDWRARWTDRRVPPAAQIAFEWALLPTRQSYGPGDYNWGMAVFGLAPGRRFDLEVVWREDGRTQRVRLRGLRCAEDVPVEPPAP